jgi:hypothetical protein
VRLLGKAPEAKKGRFCEMNRSCNELNRFAVIGAP